MASLTEFGFGNLGLKVADFLESGQIIQLGYPPNRVDILTSLKGVTFESCYNSRVITDIEGTKVDFIDLDNLIKNKRASGRYQDLADIENLEP